MVVMVLGGSQVMLAVFKQQLEVGMETWSAHRALQAEKPPYMTHFSMYYKADCIKGQRSSSSSISWTPINSVRCLKLGDLGFKPSP